MRNRILIPSNMLLAAACIMVLAVSSVRAAEAPPKPIFPDVVPVCSCENLTKVSIPNTTIDSATLDPTDGSCRVTATVTHPPSGDRVKVWIGLPVKNWNGRFRGNGGGGFSGGNPGSLRDPLRQGFAAGATDTGHEGGSGSFALDGNGRFNWQAIIELGEDVAEDVLGVGRGPDPGGEREVASAEVQGIAGRNLDVAAAAVEPAFGRACAVNNALMTVAGMVARITA
ncbi:MAG: tannase/feruloyl esterase family alpha/beta hydrolase [Verrucomicrobia bacterium]|nr:tannase/feruloyl esterase family alpha/beta hydrolase [Verrucomicrobiota bacterium]